MLLWKQEGIFILVKKDMMIIVLEIILRGGLNQYHLVNYFLSQTKNIYATSVRWTHVYTQLQIRKPAYTMQIYNLLYSIDVDH